MMLHKEFLTFDVAAVRENFPILSAPYQGKKLIYFDNAATSQKPQSVIDHLVKYYTLENANIHRGVYRLSEQASEEYEQARAVVQQHLNASSASEIIFVRGATEGINLVASTWGRKNISAGDEVLISAMEHHANLVPWQQLCKEKNAVLKIIPVDDNGVLLKEEFKNLLTEKTKILALSYISNAIGTINPVKEMIALAHKKNIPVLIDGCQASPHYKVDVQELDCDFFVFSGHKTFAPTGIGVLFGKENFLDDMPPYQMGGDMIKTVTYSDTEFAQLPNKFEAGTPHISGALGLAEAIRFVDETGRESIEEYEKTLTAYTYEKLMKMDGLTIVGNSPQRIPLFSFTIRGVHPLDIGTMIDFEGVAMRTGNHCAQPLLHRLGAPATCRISLAFYNTTDEVDYFADALQKVVKKLR